MSVNLKCKTRDKPAVYNRPAKWQKITKDTPRTSAHSPKCTSRQNLTLSDCITVYSFVDSHPTSGALNFTQSTLSRKLREHPKMEAQINDNPNALSLKRPRIVTRPDVECALILWVRHMESRRETVTGPMLREKRKRFEDEFDVPENERLSGEWLQSFCTAYKIREYRRHGEAGSVDIEAVDKERERCRKILAKFAPKDRWNFDETSFFP
ncbi:hypothetical protein P692DRAFT_201723452 [Suillus brevipes Sb2]|nr:hypothetical protein P692DRAFT_201723452 [Suillus brevipes Sb2]